jgi:tRNA A-37 threonylcarbamoyl transferase component Bud32
VGLARALAWRLASRGLPPLSAAEWAALRAGAAVLERDAAGETALRTADGRVLKLFRVDRLLSSGVLRPPARRFALAAAGLAARHVPSVEVLDVCRVDAIRRHLVSYRWLAGRPLRSALEEDDGVALVGRLADFLAVLHERGVFFRSLHFGNVLVRDDGRLALVDVSDLRFTAGALPEALRLRNVRHLGRYRADVAALRAFGHERFVDRYLAGTSRPADARVRMRAALLARLAALPGRKG